MGIDSIIKQNIYMRKVSVFQNLLLLLIRVKLESAKSNGHCMKVNVRAPNENKKKTLSILIFYVTVAT
jgi:hypothetical protein